jgi:osmotically-inducible protein OsmY
MVEGEYDSTQIGPARFDVFRSGDEIERDVSELIRLNDAIHPKDIDVIVHEGVVTLKGRVDDQVSCVEAVQAAREVIGVLDVKNELEVGQ